MRSLQIFSQLEGRCCGDRISALSQLYHAGTLIKSIRDMNRMGEPNTLIRDMNRTDTPNRLIRGPGKHERVSSGDTWVYQTY